MREWNSQCPKCGRRPVGVRCANCNWSDVDLAVPFVDQVTMWHKYRKAATKLLHQLADEQWPAVVSEAYSRMQSGVVEYGDAMFHQSDPELDHEAVEELADALNRMVVKAARAAGVDLPTPNVDE